MRHVAEAHDETRISRLLAKVDARNQVDMDAIAGRVHLSGPGVVFVTSSGEWQAWAPRVRIDEGVPHRLPFGTSFVAMDPGTHTLRFENGQPMPWHHDGVDIAVEVPADGQATLIVTGVYGSYAPPCVAPAPGSESALWLKVAEPPREPDDAE